MTVAEIITAKTSKLSGITEADILIAIDEVSEVIKNYCNISTIPDQLKYTHANMAVDLLRFQTQVNKSDDIQTQTNIESIAGDITSISLGDMSISLGELNGGSSRALKSHKADLDLIVFNYKEQLNAFRKMKW